MLLLHLQAELIANLTHKLDILKGAKESLILDIKLNNSLGEQIEALIEQLCKPNEFDKYKMFIGDLEKVVNLLLSLSGRLARVENVLRTLGEDANAEERVRASILFFFFSHFALWEMCLFHSISFTVFHHFIFLSESIALKIYILSEQNTLLRLFW